MSDNVTNMLLAQMLVDRHPRMAGRWSRPSAQPAESLYRFEDRWPIAPIEPMPEPPDWFRAIQQQGARGGWPRWEQEQGWPSDDAFESPQMRLLKEWERQQRLRDEQRREEQRRREQREREQEDRLLSNQTTIA